VRIEIEGWEVVGIHAAVCLEVAEALRRDGRALPVFDGEGEAAAWLSAEVDGGRLDALELDQRVRQIREAVVSRVLLARSGRFHLIPSRHTGAARVVARSLPALIVRGARECLEEDSLLRMTAVSDAVIELKARADERLRQADLPPELVSWVRRQSGRMLRSALANAPAEAGLAGLLAALVLGDAILLVASAQRTAEPFEATGIRDHLTAFAQLVEDADYFEILGLPVNATSRQVQKAYVRRRRRLGQLPLRDAGLDDLEALRVLAMDALDDAYEALRDPDVRREYGARLRAAVS
jgi:hypothetical protein